VGGAQSKPQTLFDKLWSDHKILESDDTHLIYIDRHLVHEVTSPQAFEGLRLGGRQVRRPDCTLATVDHNIPTDDRTGFTDIKTFMKEPEGRNQVLALEQNVADFGLKYFGMTDERQGIVHVIGPEQGFTLPGTTLVCGDSHTSTHGAFGSLAFGIGTSEVEHVLATQTLVMRPQKSMNVRVTGRLPEGVTSKDVILHIIGNIGTAGGTGYVIEFSGEVIESLSIEARMSMCNMTIEAGARAGIIAPDDMTFAYLKGRPLCPKGAAWERAVAYWRSLKTDAGAVFDKEVCIDGASIAPTVTWGTSPEDVVPITGCVPDPKEVQDPTKRSGMERALSYMGLEPGTRMEDVAVQKVFIGSCTNSRIEDLRNVARIARGRKVAEGVQAMIVPGSGLVKRQAEEEGLDKVFREAGFDWREPGCSMCLAMNPDQLQPQERCAATSNRNFEGRQGAGGRTHLMSPVMAAAAAVTGKLKDVRALSENAPAQPVKITDSKAFCTEELTMPAPTALSSSPASEGEGMAAAGAAGSAGSSGGMTKFTTLESVFAAPLRRANVDTDCIIPKQFLKTIKRTGLGCAAFFELRYEADGTTENPGFVLNQEPYRSAQILIAGENFGCGSSREHAPWAINDFGIRCIIAPSFADIFFNNCSKNGMLLIKLPKETVEDLMQGAEAKQKLSVDLPAQQITREDGSTIPFDVDVFKKHCLVNGLDEIGLTLAKVEAIAEFESQQRERFPWLYSAQQSTETTEVRVTATKSSAFYARIARNFLEGLPATQECTAKPPASQVVLSATGAAIERSAHAAKKLELNGDVEIVKIKTDFIQAPGGSKSACVPQVNITLKKRLQSQEILDVKTAGAAGGKEAGCGCGGSTTDW